MDKICKLEISIELGEFDLAREYISDMPFEEFREFIISREYNSEKKIVFYQFIEFLNFEREDVSLHNLASFLMSFCLNWMPGAYYLGMIHKIRAIELEPDNLDSLKEMLFYFEVPERPLSREKAKKLANQILEVEPGYAPALDILTMIKTMEKREIEAKEIFKNKDKYEFKTDKRDYTRIYIAESNELWIYKPNRKLDRLTQPKIGRKYFDDEMWEK